VSQTFDFLAAAAASTDTSADLHRCNPFLTREDVAAAQTATLLLMLVFSRISQANVVLAQLRGALRTLAQLQATPAAETQRRDGLVKELLATSELLGATVAMPRNFCRDATAPQGRTTVEVDPRFLLFEFCHGLTLRPSQVTLVRQLLRDMAEGRSACHQMIMGAGKTTVVGPLLAMLLASERALVLEVVPPALLEFSASVLRERFSLCVTKAVFTFAFDRQQAVTPQLVAKLEVARATRAVVVSTPSAVKSFLLKFLELCHNLARQKSLQLERREKKAVESLQLLSKVRGLLGMGARLNPSAGEMSFEQIEDARRQLRLCERIFGIFREAVEIMDEVDTLLHPLKSELNWPLGLKEPLDFTRSRAGNGLRWSLPSHLLDALFGVCNVPILSDVSDSKAAGTCRASASCVSPLCLTCVVSCVSHLCRACVSSAVSRRRQWRSSRS
jgi:hypothetical protein